MGFQYIPGAEREFLKSGVEDPDSIGSDVFLTWENVEQRRAACEIVGWG